MSEPVTVVPEPTPNPNATKFTVSRVVNPEKRGKSFMNRAACGGFPLAEKLWDALGEGVVSIFVVNNFFTITQNGSLDPRAMASKVEQVVQAHFAAS